MTDREKQVDEIRKSAANTVAGLPRTRDELRIAYVKPSYVQAIERAAKVEAERRVASSR